MDNLFLITALIGGTVLAVQFVLMLLGIGESGDVGGGIDGDIGGGIDGDLSGGEDHATWAEAADADLGHPGSPWFYEVLSLRTLSAAVAFFGLTGKTMLAYEYTELQSFVAAALAGAAAMYIVYWLFLQVYKLQHAGNENILNAVGLPATVYVPIPGKRAGAGKVTFRLQNRLVEYLAVTENDERLATGEKVIIVSIVNSDTVRVDRAAAPVSV